MTILADKKKQTQIKNLQDGTTSKYINEIVKDMGLSVLDEINKSELPSYEKIKLRAKHIVDDLYVYKVLSDTVKATGIKAFDEEKDLMHTTMAMARNIERLKFHLDALDDLKLRYNSANDEEKPQIYDQIEKCEKVIASFDKSERDYLTIRGNIRKEVSKNNYQKESLDIQKTQKRTISANDIDYDIIDVD